MYNHYIPQSDGSYRRSQQPEQRRPAPPPKLKPEQQKECPPEPPRPAPSSPAPPPPCTPQTGILDFFKKLLPRQIDTADMLIICLLLLMNQDEEAGLSPMLTLALYFLL